MNVLLSLLFSLVLIGLSAAFSGLALGLFSLNTEELRRKAKLGNPEAQLVYPIRVRGAELFVALVIGNVLVNVALVLMLRSMLPSGGLIMALLTLIIATTLIVLFGEITPQVFFKRHGLKIGALLAPFIDFVLRLIHPIVHPLSGFIGRSIGDDGIAFYDSEELIHILEEHVKSEDNHIEADELRIVRSALEFGDKLVDDIMTPRSMIVAVEKNQEITTGLLSKLQKSGHTRIPVYDETLDNIVGVVYMHDLIGRQNPHMTTYSIAHKPAYYVNDQQQLDHVLNAFIKTRHHLFIVINEFEETVGIVTIEDILEQIIGRKIVDEFDRFDDIRAVAKLHAKQRRATRGLIGSKKG